MKRLAKNNYIRGWFIGYCLLICGLWITSAFAGATRTTTNNLSPTGSTIYWKHSIIIQADNAGVCTTTIPMHGAPVRMVTYPLSTTGGITTTVNSLWDFPLSTYACRLNDTDGVDLLGGAGSLRINTLTQQVHPWGMGTYVVYYPRMDGDASLVCTNLGTAKRIGVTLYVQE